MKKLSPAVYGKRWASETWSVEISPQGTSGMCRDALRTFNRRVRRGEGREKSPAKENKRFLHKRQQRRCSDCSSKMREI